MLALPKTDNRILWLLRALLGLCLVSPLFVSGALAFPYTGAKAFVFRILIELAAVFYFYLALKYPDFRPKKTALTLAVLIFLTVWFLASLFGADFYSSFWGNLERMLGFWGMLHFAALFLMLGSLFKNRKEWGILLKISVGTSCLIAFLAIMQKFYSLGSLLPQTDRVFGTIGNAAFLAGYLIFNLFFTIYLFFVARKKSLGKINITAAILFGAAFLLQLTALIMTGTRGALLGFSVGILFLLVAFAFFGPMKKWRRYFLGLIILSVILAALLFGFRQSSFVKNNFILRRLTSISLQDTTSQNRLILWQKSWEAWQEKPIFGWGPENFEVAANKYFDPRLNPYEAWYDRAHNFVFDYGVTAGWLGLLSYLGLMAAAFFCLRKIAKSSEENFYFSALFASLALAYLFQNLFVFDSFVSYLMLFFALAAINFYYKESLSSEQKEAKSRLLGFGSKMAVMIFAALIIFCVYSLNLKAISASRLANQILSFSPETESIEELNFLLQKVVSSKTFASGEIIYQITLDYLAKISTTPQLTQNEDFYKLASRELQKNIEESLLQVKNYIALGWLNLYFSGADSERVDKAVELAEKAKELSSAKKDAYLILVAAYSLKGESAKAQEVVAQTEKISPDLAAEVSQYWQNLNK